MIFPIVFLELSCAASAMTAARSAERSRCGSLNGKKQPKRRNRSYLKNIMLDENDYLQDNSKMQPKAEKASRIITPIKAQSNNLGKISGRMNYGYEKEPESSSANQESYYNQFKEEPENDRSWHNEDELSYENQRYKNDQQLGYNDNEMYLQEQEPIYVANELDYNKEPQENISYQKEELKNKQLKKEEKDTKMNATKKISKESDNLIREMLHGESLDSNELSAEEFDLRKSEIPIKNENYRNAIKYAREAVQKDNARRKVEKANPKNGILEIFGLYDKMGFLKKIYSYAKYIFEMLMKPRFESDNFEELGSL
jgi:hypothetical protein